MIEADLVMPGVYDAVLKLPGTATTVGVQAYIVLKAAEDISDTAKRYGVIDPDYPELLVYSENDAGNTCYIISYELSATGRCISSLCLTTRFSALLPPSERRYTRNILAVTQYPILHHGAVPPEIR